MSVLEKTIGYFSIFLFVLNFLLLIYADMQQRRLLKGEKQISGFLYYYKAHKWLKLNAETLPEHKKAEYRRYLLNRKLQYVTLFILFILYLVYNFIFNL